MENTKQEEQYEKFIASIDTNELITRIRRFRSLNIKRMTDLEISNAVLEVLTYNDEFVFRPILGNYDKGTVFYRVRRLENMEFPNSKLNEYSDFWEPPSHVVKKRGRLNKEGESLLYVSPGDPKVPINELKIKEGEFYALIIYEATDIVKTNFIGLYLDGRDLEISNERAIINNNLIIDFLRDEFSRDVGVGTEYLYKVSELIAKDYFDLPPEIVQDAWGYSSVHDKSKYNLCFRPEIAHKLLKLKGALLCLKDDTDYILVKSIGICTSTVHLAEIHPLGSKKQKQYFPELTNK